MENTLALDIHMGQRLAKARHAAGLTLQQLADRLGWHLSTLHNYEMGRRPLKLAHFISIAEALHREPAALLVDSDEAAAVIEQIASSEERSLQVAFFLEHMEDPPPPEDDDIELGPSLNSYQEFSSE